MGARPVERRHQRVLVRLAGQRQRGQVDPGRPALGARDEQVDVGVVEAELEAAVEERPGLLGGEAQRVGPQLEQLPVRPQRAERQGRVGPGREHELERRRHVVDEPRDALPRRRAGEPVEVVEHQRQLGLLGELVDEPRQQHLDDRRRGGGRGQRLVREARAGAAQRLDDVRPQHDRVVVALVERDPRHRPPLRLLLAPGREQDRLAEARRAGDERELQPAPSPQPLEQPLARDGLRRDERGMELGDEEDRCVRTGGLAHGATLAGGSRRRNGEPHV